MDEQLDRAPCGFFVLNKDLEIIEMNQTLRDILKMHSTPIHFQDLLTLPSRVYFQTYFLPAISVYKQVREMYLNFRLGSQSLPVLVNVNERDGLYEGIIVKIKTRNEYEAQMLAAKKNAERIQQETDLANEKLKSLLKDVESKQRELEELNNDLQILAARDELTGLCNRRVFRKNFAHAIEHAEKDEQQAFSLAILDIDHFKQVNDRFGHAVGDEVLLELAQKMEEIVPRPHEIARIGGEEFAIIFYEANGEKAVDLAEELRHFIAHSKWENVAITISVGITRFREGDSANSLFIRADDALYESKNNGRNRVTTV